MRLVLLAVACASALAVAAHPDAGQPDKAKGPTASAHKTYTVRIVDMKFDPADLVVNRGDTIVWKNDDLVTHTVTGEPISSPPIEGGRTFEWFATKTGTIDYTCTLHPSMHGRVTVK